MAQQSQHISTPQQFPISFYHHLCKDFKALPKLCLDMVKFHQGESKSIFPSLDCQGLYKLLQRTWAGRVSTILCLGEILCYICVLFAGETDQGQSFCGQWNKKALMNCLGMVITFYIAIKKDFSKAKKWDPRESSKCSHVHLLSLFERKLSKR